MSASPTRTWIVLVGPRVVYAFETKYMNAADDRRLDAAGRQASMGARRIGNLLPSGGVEREVVPVVVIWGRGRHHLGEPYRVRGGVRFVSGVEHDRWLDLLRRSDDHQEADVEAYDVIAEFVRRREQFESRRARGGLRRFLLSQ